MIDELRQPIKRLAGWQICHASNLRSHAPPAMNDFRTLISSLPVPAHLPMQRPMEPIVYSDPHVWPILKPTFSPSPHWYSCFTGATLSDSMADHKISHNHGFCTPHFTDHSYSEATFGGCGHRRPPQLSHLFFSNAIR